MTAPESNEMATLSSTEPAAAPSSTPTPTSTNPAESTPAPTSNGATTTDAPTTSAAPPPTSIPKPADEDITTVPTNTSTTAAPPMQRKETEAIGAASEDNAAAVPKADPDAGPTVLITLLLTTGKRHPYKIDSKYLRKRNVTVEDNDPYNLPVEKLKELILRDWRDGELRFLVDADNIRDPLRPPNTPWQEWINKFAKGRDDGPNARIWPTLAALMEASKPFMSQYTVDACRSAFDRIFELRTVYATETSKLAQKPAWEIWSPDTHDAYWEEKPNSPTAIRLIMMGLELQEGELLRDKRFNRTSANIVHMVIKREMPEDEELKDGKKRPSEEDGGRRITASRTVIGPGPVIETVRVRDGSESGPDRENEESQCPLRKLCCLRGGGDDSYESLAKDYEGDERMQALIKAAQEGQKLKQEESDMMKEIERRRQEKRAEKKFKPKMDPVEERPSVESWLDKTEAARMMKQMGTDDQQSDHGDYYRSGSPDTGATRVEETQEGNKEHINPHPAPPRVPQLDGAQDKVLSRIREYSAPGHGQDNGNYYQDHDPDRDRPTEPFPPFEPVQPIPPLHLPPPTGDGASVHATNTTRSSRRANGRCQCWKTLLCIRRGPRPRLRGGSDDDSFELDPWGNPINPRDEPSEYNKRWYQPVNEERRKRRRLSMEREAPAVDAETARVRSGFFPEEEWHHDDPPRDELGNVVPEQIALPAVDDQEADELKDNDPPEEAQDNDKPSETSSQNDAKQQKLPKQKLKVQKTSKRPFKGKVTRTAAEGSPDAECGCKCLKLRCYKGKLPPAAAAKPFDTERRCKCMGIRVFLRGGADDETESYGVGGENQDSHETRTRGTSMVLTAQCSAELFFLAEQALSVVGKGRAPDPLIFALAQLATQNLATEAILRIVASGQASHTQLFYFGTRVSLAKEMARAQQEQNGESATDDDGGAPLDGTDDSTPANLEDRSPNEVDDGANASHHAAPTSGSNNVAATLRGGGDPNIDEASSDIDVEDNASHKSAPSQPSVRTATSADANVPRATYSRVEVEEAESDTAADDEQVFEDDPLYENMDAYGEGDNNTPTALLSGSSALDDPDIYDEDVEGDVDALLDDAEPTRRDNNTGLNDHNVYDEDDEASLLESGRSSYATAPNGPSDLAEASTDAPTFASYIAAHAQADFGTTGSSTNVHRHSGLSNSSTILDSASGNSGNFTPVARAFSRQNPLSRNPQNFSSAGTSLGSDWTEDVSDPSLDDDNLRQRFLNGIRATPSLNPQLADQLSNGSSDPQSTLRTFDGAFSHTHHPDLSGSAAQSTPAGPIRSHRVRNYEEPHPGGSHAGPNNSARSYRARNYNEQYPDRYEMRQVDGPGRTQRAPQPPSPVPQDEQGKFDDFKLPGPASPLPPADSDSAGPSTNMHSPPVDQDDVDAITPAPPVDKGDTVTNVVPVDENSPYISWNERQKQKLQNIKSRPRKTRPQLCCIACEDLLKDARECTVNCRTLLVITVVGVIVIGIVCCVVFCT